MKRVVVLLGLLFALCAQPAQAIVPTAEQSLTLAYHYWGGYCDGSTPEQSVQITYDSTLKDQGYAGLATGVVLYDDGRVVLNACTISIVPGMEPAMECRVIFHEVGHLAGHRHEEGGIMSATLPDEPFAPCDPTPREAVIQAVRKELPAGQWVVHCTSSLTRCRATNPKAKRSRRFEVVDRDPEQVFPLDP